MRDEIKENRDERNIMILFLSNFLFDDLNRNEPDPKDETKKEVKKVLKTPATYRITRLHAGQSETILPACIQTNEAPIKDILFQLDGKPLDAIFCFVSEKVGGRGKFAGKKVPVWRFPEDEKPKEYNNHIELFWERLQSINEDDSLKGILKSPLSKDLFHLIDFNESALDPSAECIRATLAMEKQIKDYIEKEEDATGNKLSMKNCHLYADITGGMRTANMTMSAATQLLQYDGAHLERVVYSDYAPGRNPNPVSNVQPINDLYKLVAGVYAFTQYGRSEALEDYFMDEDYAPLQNLRDAMDDFSEAVQLCQPKKIEVKLLHLEEELQRFSEKANKEPNKSPKVELFMQMIPNLQAIYSKMIKKKDDGTSEPNRLEIIQWSIRNKLLQQAVTFCTEWLPEYLLTHSVLFSNDEAIQYYCNGLSRMRPGEKAFLMEFCTANRDWKKIQDAAVHNEIKALIKKEKDLFSVREALPKYYSDLLDDLSSLLKKIPNALNRIRNGHPIKDSRLESMVERIAKNKRKEMTEVTEQELLDSLTMWVFDANLPYFEIPPYENKYGNWKKIPLNQDEKTENVEKITRQMLSKGMMQTALRDPEKAIYFAKEYTRIRTELRNKICHANETESTDEKSDDESLTIQTVTTDLDNYLKEIQRIDELIDPNKPKYAGVWKQSIQQEATP